MKYLLAQFIPIILIFVVVTYSKPMAIFSNTTLGKILAIGIIIYYTYLDKYIGLLVCATIILYYQSDYVENMLNIDDDGENDDEDEKDEDETMKTMNDTTTDATNLPKSKIVTESFHTNTQDNEKQSKSKSNVANDQFREQNCKNGVLQYKDMTVRAEMAGHIFPELSFANADYPCNPCDKTCGISIIEAKLDTESKISSIQSLAYN